MKTRRRMKRTTVIPKTTTTKTNSGQENPCLSTAKLYRSVAKFVPDENSKFDGQ